MARVEKTVFISYRRAKDLDGAIEDYNEAITGLAPLGKAASGMVASVLIFRGNAFAYKGLSSAALADYNEALRRRPNDARAFFHRGLLRLSQGDNGGAIDVREAERLGYKG